MNWIILIVFLVVLGILIWKMPDIKDWHQERKYQNMCTWVMEHKAELPIDPTVINAGEWTKIEENSNPIVQKDGIYIFICRGDNHLFYEVYGLYRGFELLSPFQRENAHSNGWLAAKPLYYYYVPYNTECLVPYKSY